MAHDHAPTRPQQAAAVLGLALALLAAPDAEARGARSFKSGPIQVDAAGRAVWVANPEHDSVSRIDAASGSWGVVEHPLEPAGAAHSPRGLSVSEDGSRAWVACHDGDHVHVLDDTGAELALVDLPWGGGPYSVALSRPDPASGEQRFALVTLHRGGACALIDAATHELVRVLEPMYRSPLGIAWAEDGVTAWVTHLFADGEHPRLSRIDVSDPADPKVKTRRRVGPTQPQRSSQLADPAEGAEGGYFTMRGHLAQAPAGADGSRLWMAVQYRNIHQDIPTPDTTVQASVRKIDPARRTVPDSNANLDKVVLTARHVHDVSAGGAWRGEGWDLPVAGPVDLAFSSDGAVAWFAFENSDNLAEVPTDTPPWKSAPTDALRTLDVGPRPMGIAVSPTADLAFVANVNDRTVSVIDLSGWSEVARVDVLAGRADPTPPSLLNGSRLFHTSDDPRISSSRKISCASCHLNAEHDGTNWDTQFVGQAPCPGGGVPGVDVCQNGPGTRATQSLLGLSLSFGGADPLTGFGQLHHAGDRDEVQDFDWTFRSIQMGGTGFLDPADLHPALDPNRNDADPDLNDLAAYVLSLEALARSPHRADDGSLTEAAVRGAAIFRGTDPARPADALCASCHLPDAAFTDFGFHDVGQGHTRNAGTQRPGPPDENQFGNRTDPTFDWHANTPSLVGAFATAPYAGASRWPSESMLGLLEDLRRPGRVLPHGDVSGLTNRQLRDLEEFVLSIDGDMTGAEVAAAVDDAPPRVERVEAASPRLLSVWFSESVKPEAADPARWRLTDPWGRDVAITGATFDAQNGDRLWLDVDRLEAGCGELLYTLEPAGLVEDLAGLSSGGAANAMDLSGANARVLRVSDTYTVTIGGSGYETLTAPVHDAATIGNLRSWSHGSVFISTDPNGRNSSTGFLRIEWAPALSAATGGTLASADLVDAAYELHPAWGDSQELEVRRTLRSWADGGWSDFTSNAPGRITWNHAVAGSVPWRQGNALGTSPGVDGSDPAHYDANDDTADVADFLGEMPAINEPFVVASPRVLEAFRFWFENPSLDHGYAIRITDGQFNETRFHRVEEDLALHSPRVRVSYRVPLTLPSPGEVSARPAPEQLRVAKDPAGWRLSFEDLGFPVSGYNVYEGAIGSWYSHAEVGCDVAAADLGARREQLVADTAGSRYWLVTASTGCEEGTAGYDSLAAERDPALSGCGGTN